MSAGQVHRMRTICLGPERRLVGRNYGLRSDPAGLALPEREMLQCLAETISGWSQQDAADRVPGFAIFKQLPGGNRYVLLRGAKIGQGTLGTVAAAHGLLIDAEVLAALHGHAELLLAAIPQLGPADWTVPEVRVELVDPQIEASTLCDGQRLREQGAVQIAVPAREFDDRQLGRLLGSLEIEALPVPPEWTTCVSFPPIYIFEPSCFAVRIHLLAEGDGLLDGDELVWHKDELHGPAGVVPRGAWSWLFRGSAARWDPAWRSFEPVIAIAATIQSIPLPSRSPREVFSLLSELAREVRTIPDDHRREVAAAGLLAFFSHVDQIAGRFAPLLDAWIARVWPLISDLVENPLRLAIERRCLDLLAPESIRALLRPEPTREVFDLLAGWLEVSAIEVPEPAVPSGVEIVLETLIEHGERALSEGRRPAAAVHALLDRWCQLRGAQRLDPGPARLLDRCLGVMIEAERVRSDILREWSFLRARAALRVSQPVVLGSALGAEISALRQTVEARSQGRILDRNIASSLQGWALISGLITRLQGGAAYHG